DNPPDLTDASWTVMRFAEYENPKGDLEWLIRKDGCMHCADPGCLKACPSPGAIVQYSNGIVDFHEENCIGCGYCIAGCPFDIPRISKRDHKAYSCTLCSDRVAVGLEPACIKACPTGTLVFGTKEDMQQHAAERVEDLKSRGFEQAGLYDPPGVGGTHVMYVLHHADRPELYAGLAADPHISSLVGLWKGVSKPIALAAMAFTVLAGFFHFVRVGRNEIDERDEAAARQALEAAPQRNASQRPGAQPPEKRAGATRDAAPPARATAPASAPIAGWPPSGSGPRRGRASPCSAPPSSGSATCSAVAPGPGSCTR